jgi:hypothetical protein
MKKHMRIDRPIDPAELLALAEAVQNARHARAEAFPKLSSLTADPTWDILLFLFIAQYREETITVIKACNSTFAPRATAVRHIRLCEQQGYIDRTADTTDRRRVFLALTPSGIAAMRRYFGQLQLTAV